MPVVVKVSVNSKLNFKSLASELASPTELLRELQTFRRNSFYAKIASGFDAKGERVAPLKEPYKTTKRKKWGKRPERVASGNMQATYDSEVMGNNLIESMSSPIAIFHQKGTVNMAQRQLLPESWDDLSGREKKAIERLLKEETGKILTKFAQSLR